MTEAQFAMIMQLRDQGFAVCVFTPEELETGEASTETVEERMCMAGWDAINGD